MSFLSKIRVNGENKTTKKIQNQRFAKRKKQAKKLQSLRNSVQKAEDKLTKKEGELAGKEYQLFKKKLHQQMIKAMSRILADYQQLSSNTNFFKLEKLATLREKGILTEKEFQNKKEELLSLI